LLNILTGLSFEGFCFGSTAVSIPDRARSILLQSANVQSQVIGVDEALSFDSPNGAPNINFNFRRACRRCRLLSWLNLGGGFSTK
jgi:hypothetical protein